jgi:hypothetical protein
LPRAEDMTATTYQGQDTCVAVRRKVEYGRKSVEVCQGAQRISSWTRGLISSEELEEYLSTIVPRLLQEKIYWWHHEYFEPIPEKISAIASGATPIVSAGRAPDKKEILRKNSTKRQRICQKKRQKKEEEIGAYDWLQVPVHSLGGYLHQEHWSCTRWQWTNLTTNKIGAIDYLSSTMNFDFIVDKIKIDYSHRELFMRF